MSESRTRLHRLAQYEVGVHLLWSGQRQDLSLGRWK
jgi:hypothetical protein